MYSHNDFQGNEQVLILCSWICQGKDFNSEPYYYDFVQ